MTLILASLFTIFMGLALAGSYVSHGLFCVGVLGMIVCVSGAIAIVMDRNKENET